MVTQKSLILFQNQIKNEFFSLTFSILLFSFMQGKFLVDKSPFDPEITKIERKNRKKKKQANTITPAESSSSDYFSTDKPLVENNLAERGEGNRPPRRMVGDCAYQQGPKQ